ncbi:MAG: RNA polymerase sigma factor [Proteobacteria bacterium]|nr:RNA polymerase sigma factor [Pseudomonadota bacterium]
MQTATSPFVDQEDRTVVEAAQQGDRGALTELIERHRPWIYNIALRMLGDPETAEDATQDIFIKLLVRIGSFEGRSAFRTWLYRVAFHHLLNLKRTRFEIAVGDFDHYEAGLRGTPNLDLDDIPVPERVLLVEEAKIVCMTGMLLCLNRDQRLAFVLGSIFGLSNTVAAEILEVQPAAFRKRLQRARGDLPSFMNNNCGLINEDNPCGAPARPGCSWTPATSTARNSSSSATTSSPSGRWPRTTRGSCSRRSPTTTPRCTASTPSPIRSSSRRSCRRCWRRPSPTSAPSPNGTRGSPSPP